MDKRYDRLVSCQFDIEIFVSLGKSGESYENLHNLILKWCIMINELNYMNFLKGPKYKKWYRLRFHSIFVIDAVLVSLNIG